MWLDYANELTINLPLAALDAFCLANVVVKPGLITACCQNVDFLDKVTNLGYHSNRVHPIFASYLYFCFLCHQLTWAILRTISRAFSC
jgi:hypothetical protein